MDAGSVNPSSVPPVRAPDGQLSDPANLGTNTKPTDTLPSISTSSLSSWARNLKFPQPLLVGQDESASENSTKSAFARFTSGIGLRLSPKDQAVDDQSSDVAPAQSNIIGTITKGIVDSSKNAVKAVQVKARHVVSQNKRRYQEGGFDLDMTYITENIIAMGFPAGDKSSGFLGYVEGLYRNHMEEVIRFFETHHQGKYKVYNLCSERLYDASLFEGKVASFPFDDHNCPPIQLIISFCQSAYSWLKEDIENVVVVHCKAGMARTGLMISSLLLYLKFFPTAEESVVYYNQKRCIDGKALVLPSQIRYVKYFERTLTYFNGENQPGRRCMLRGFRLHKCPYWIRPHITVSNHNGILFSSKKHPRTKDLSPEDFWFSAPRKGIMVFALPGEPGLAELTGDFKVLFHDRQGDFYFWLNTTMIENRKTLNTSDIDWFDKRKLPSPGFQVEVVLIDYDVPASTTPISESVAKKPEENLGSTAAPVNRSSSAAADSSQVKSTEDRDDVFSDSEADEGGSLRGRSTQMVTSVGATRSTIPSGETEGDKEDRVEALTHDIKQVSVGKSGPSQVHTIVEQKRDVAAGLVPEVPASSGVSEFKAMAADASVFTFGDDEDYESE
ncbi:Phosphatidylinositol 3,4,5-trisphosphate 3-phosphatase and protein-tyrosine-phosphatase pten2a [Dionaea muscipula]